MSNLQCKIKGRYALPHLSSTRLKFWKLILLSFKRVPSNVCYPLKYNGTDLDILIKKNFQDTLNEKKKRCVCGLTT